MGFSSMVLVSDDGGVLVLKASQKLQTSATSVHAGCDIGSMEQRFADPSEDRLLMPGEVSGQVAVMFSGYGSVAGSARMRAYVAEVPPRFDAEGKMLLGSILSKVAVGFQLMRLVSKVKNHAAKNDFSICRCCKGNGRRRSRDDACDVIMKDFFSVVKLVEAQGRNHALLHGEIAYCGPLLEGVLPLSHVGLPEVRTTIPVGVLGLSRVVNRMVILAAVDLKGHIKLEDAGFDGKVLGPDAQEVDYDALACDQVAYTCNGQRCSSQSLLLRHENWTKSSLVFKLKRRKLAMKRKLQDLTLGPILTVSDVNPYVADSQLGGEPKMEGMQVDLGKFLGFPYEDTCSATGNEYCVQSCVCKDMPTREIGRLGEVSETPNLLSHMIVGCDPLSHMGVNVGKRLMLLEL
ncbi:hypothetical protein NE237_017638 [Protea cynaroides]|uniref:Uncharacterized protein n=1 Tax=Protea cynaroides TaxID=273540 RepID=A0A9Q0QNE9_9MAGN|nr:hypothetical protein NE237_017638 [Protea cynaroides]